MKKFLNKLKKFMHYIISFFILLERICFLGLQQMMSILNNIYTNFSYIMDFLFNILEDLHVIQFLNELYENIERFYEKYYMEIIWAFLISSLIRHGIKFYHIIIDLITFWS